MPAVNAAPEVRYSQPPRSFKKTLIRSSGRQRAVFIGINYSGTQYSLKGCVPDAYNVSRFLKKNYHFPKDDFLLMTDEPFNKGTALFPTRENITKAFNWLVDGALAGDSLFLSYSGHGGYKRDQNGDEIDGYDETIYPVDFPSAGPMVDDDIFNMLVDPLPAGVRLTALFDSCHSGTIMDLQCMYDPNGQDLVTTIPPVKGPALIAVMLQAAFKNCTMGFKFPNKRINPPRRFAAGDVVCFSGCKDDELSIDVQDNTGSHGAMSSFWIQCISEQPTRSFSQILKDVQQRLQANGYQQTPCLSTSHQLNLDEQFHL